MNFYFWHYIVYGTIVIEYTKSKDNGVYWPCYFRYGDSDIACLSKTKEEKDRVNAFDD